MERVYAFVVRHLKKETLEQSPALRSLLVTHIIDTCSTLNREKENTWALDGLNVLRLNYCVVLDYTARLMHRFYFCLLFYPLLKSNHFSFLIIIKTI